MIRILHILWWARFGGIERLVVDLVSVQLNNPQMQVGVLFCRKEGEFVDEFQKAGLSSHFLGLNSGYDVSPWKYLTALHLFQEYDILHFHGFNTILAGCAVISKKRIIYTVHSTPGRRRITRSDRVKASFLKRFLNFHVDYISFNSEFTKIFFEKLYGLHRVSRSIVYNGIPFKKDCVPLSVVEESILKKVRGKFIVGTTVRFVEFKRIHRLIRAFADFQWNKDTILLLVGDGVLRDELGCLIKELKLCNKTILTGFKHNVRQFQSLMDVCVFPSEGEPFGIVAVETLSLGKPTIVFEDGGGIAEIVRGISKADVVEDIPHLVQRLEYYFNHREKIDDLAHQRVKYAERFDIENMAAQFDSIYGKLVYRASA